LFVEGDSKVALIRNVFFFRDAFVFADGPVGVRKGRMLSVAGSDNFVHEGEGAIGMKVVGVELDEGLDEDGLGFWREVVEDAFEDVGGALIGFEVLVELDVFGG
jgi:hypothetical protein